MIRPGQPESCVFCGRLIEADEPHSGRGSAAAHIECADAALRDESLWDRIAAASGDTGHSPASGDARRETDEPARGRPAAGSRTGCLVLATTIGAGIALVVATSCAL